MQPRKRFLCAVSLVRWLACVVHGIRCMRFILRLSICWLLPLAWIR